MSDTRVATVSPPAPSLATRMWGLAPPLHLSTFPRPSRPRAHREPQNPLLRNSVDVSRPNLQNHFQVAAPAAQKRGWISLALCSGSLSNQNPPTKPTDATQTPLVGDTPTPNHPACREAASRAQSPAGCRRRTHRAVGQMHRESRCVGAGQEARGSQPGSARRKHSHRPPRHHTESGPRASTLFSDFRKLPSRTTSGNKASLMGRAEPGSQWGLHGEPLWGRQRDPRWGRAGPGSGRPGKGFGDST